MKVLIDNSNDDAVFIANQIEYAGNAASARNEAGDILLILGDMTPSNSRIEDIEFMPDDFTGRNYIYTDGVLMKKIAQGD